MVRVALLLARDGVDDDEQQPLRERLAGREPAGLPDQDVRRRHVLVHRRRVADDGERVRSPGALGGERAEPLPELLVAPADDHDLGGMAQLEEARDGVLDRSDAEAARREEHDRPVGEEPELLPHGALVLRLGEHRIDRDAARGHLAARDAEAHQVLARLVDGHEVVLEMMAEPHRVHVEVGHDDRLRAREPPLGLEPRDDLGGQEVGAEDQVRPVLLEHAHERARVELVPGETPSLLLPRRVEPIVEPAEHVGRAVHQLDVGLRVEGAEDLVGELERVDVVHLARGTQLRKGALQRLRGADVTRARGGREDEDLPGHRRIVAGSDAAVERARREREEPRGEA